VCIDLRNLSPQGDETGAGTGAGAERRRQVALRWRQRRQLKSRGARRRERERREKAAEEIRPHIDASASEGGAGGYASQV